MKITKPKVITLRYTINGAKFKLHYAMTADAVARARERIEVLRQFGVKVKVKGWPKKVVTQIAPLEGE